MKPEDLIKYVFREESQDYEARFIKCRKVPFVQAKQRAMWLLKHFYPKLSYNQIGTFFGGWHDMSIHACRVVNNHIATEKKYSDEMSKYILVLRDMMNAKLKINCTSVMYKMTNKRAILRKTTLGYEITLKRLNSLSGFRDQVEQTTLNISDEAMQGLIECYNILNK
jgi:hypothetical protein